MIRKLNESLILKKTATLGGGTNSKRLSQHVRCFFTRNKHRYNEVFLNHVITQLTQEKDVVIVVSKALLPKVASILKEKKLFSFIDQKNLIIYAHILESRTGFYFQKDFTALLKPIANSLNNKNYRVIFFDADALIHCELADAERRQVRDFLIVAERIDLKVDLLSAQTYYEGLKYLEN